MVFCNKKLPYNYFNGTTVTILILIDGFLQYEHGHIKTIFNDGHNPYFNRWFSAILIDANGKMKTAQVTILILIDGFLQLRSL